jgi:glycosyltransferase involved in cell wall biosynthesis
MPAVLQHVPTARLLVAGSGDLDAELRQRARDLGIVAGVRFLGSLNHDEVAATLAAVDVVAVPSVRDDAGNVDGLPNVVMEALASGTPLVTTTAGGIGAVTTHGRNAWQVPERDVASLANALVHLLTHPAERSAMGARARAEALALRSWDGVAERFEHAYERAARDRGRAAG